MTSHREALPSACMRSFLVAAGAAVAAVGLGGCGDADLTDAERAVAECANAVHEDLDLLDGQTVRTRDVGVGLGAEGTEGRMSGRWEVAGVGRGEFTCLVVPDEDDELRGLRVTELQVWVARDQV